jgi:alkylation response protein AidB-like acyl-CoA dehydrogenase
VTHSVFDRIIRRQPLADEEWAIVEALRSLVARDIAPRAERHDRDGEFPWDNIRDLNALDLNLAFLPEAHGGAELSYRCYLMLVEELSAGCASTGVTWATTFHAVSPIVDFGSEEQKERFLPAIAAGGLGALAITEASGGSDATAMSTSFAPQGDNVVVNGDKLFITSGDVADVYLVFGKWSQIDDPRKSLTALVVEKGTPGLEVVGKEDKMGHRASSTVALSFRDCVVPASNILGAPGGGLGVLFAALNKSRPSIAAHALGIARAAFDDATGYVNEREQFGHTVIDFQGVQFMLADLATRLALTQSWIFHVAGLVESGEEVPTEASMLKLAASDLAMDMATAAVQLFGGYGYCKGMRVERLFRDAKLTQIWEGTNQLQRQVIGRAFRTRRAR